MPKKGLVERLSNGGTIVCAEGYLLEFERRGYLEAGGYFPEVVLEHPEAVTQLHEEFVHAGSDVVVAFTFYGFRQKMRAIGREDDVEKLNKNALRLAKEVADKHDCLFAGNICNTGLFLPENYDEIRSVFQEQTKLAKEEGVDMIIAETFKSLNEALLALEVIKEHGIPAVISISPHTSDMTFDGVYIPDALKALEDNGAAVVGLNCGRGPSTMLPLAKEATRICKGPVAALPVVYRTTEDAICWQALTDPDNGTKSFPFNLQCHQCTRSEIRQFGQDAKEAGIQYIGLCCGNSSNYTREIAEVYGRKPAASKYKPSMEHSLYFADESKMSERAKQMHRFLMGVKE